MTVVYHGCIDCTDRTTREGVRRPRIEEVPEEVMAEVMDSDDDEAWEPLDDAALATASHPMAHGGPPGVQADEESGDAEVVSARGAANWQVHPQEHLPPPGGISDARA